MMRTPGAVSGLVLAAVLGGGLLGLGGCGGGAAVLRVADGRSSLGPAVSAEGYAAALEGGAAAQAGDGARAEERLRLAADLAGGDGYVRAQAADVACRGGRANEGRRWAGEAANDGVDAVEPLLAEARCALAVGDKKRAFERAEKALATSRVARPDGELLAVAAADDGALRARGPRLFTLTAIEPTSSAAWEALALWARTVGDVETEARALAARAATEAGQGSRSAAEVERLARAGALTPARRLAAALVDHAPVRAWAPHGEATLVEALAVDEALARDDVGLARRRASRGRLARGELVARALLLGLGDHVLSMGPALAEEALGNPVARLAYVALRAHEGDLRPLARLHDEGWGVPADPEPGASSVLAERVPAAVAIAAARVTARVYGPADARALVRPLALDPVREGDDLALGGAVQLVAEGAFQEGALPPDGEVELRLRRGEAPDAKFRAAYATKLSPRHLRLLDAFGPRPSADGRALVAATGPRDALTLVAEARLGLLGAPAQAAKALVDVVPPSPMALRLAIGLLEPAEGDDATLVRARALLAAYAATPAERRACGLSADDPSTAQPGAVVERRPGLSR